MFLYVLNRRICGKTFESVAVFCNGTFVVAPRNQQKPAPTIKQKPRQVHRIASYTHIPNIYTALSPSNTGRIVVPRSTILSFTQEVPTVRCLCRQQARRRHQSS